MSTQMKDPRDLFLHEQRVLYAERTLVKTLPKLQAEAADDEEPRRASGRASRGDPPAREEPRAGVREAG